MNLTHDKAREIKLLILDVDGILTNGLLYYGNDHFQMRAFHIHDGLGMKLLQKAGIPIAVISGKQSEAVQKRLKDLNIEHVYLGYEVKQPAYLELKNKLKLEDHQIAYMGDDLPDLPLLKKVGFSVTVPEAPNHITKAVHHVTKKSAGFGAVREVCELILIAQQKFDSVVESFND